MCITKAYGRADIYLHALLREVNNQLHALTIFSLGEKTPVPIYWRTSRPQTWLGYFGGEKNVLLLPRIKWFLHHPPCSSVTVPIVLSWHCMQSWKINSNPIPHRNGIWLEEMKKTFYQYSWFGCHDLNPGHSKYEAEVQSNWQHHSINAELAFHSLQKCPYTGYSIEVSWGSSKFWHQLDKNLRQEVLITEIIHLRYLKLNVK